MYRKFFKTAAATLAAMCIMCTTAFAHDAYIDKNMDYVVHAGGEVDGVSGTNSMDALKNSFLYGYRFIELDFNFTSDGKLVCIHDWDLDYCNTNKKVGQAMSYDEFVNAKFDSKYTTVTADSLAKWLNGKPNTYIITDIKESNIEGLKYISENYGWLCDKFIPQIYNEEQYDQVKKLGFNNIIYTLYMLNFKQKTDTDEIVKFAQNHDLAAIVFPDELATDDYVSKLKKSGTRLLVHTVNDVTELERLKNIGVDGVYSDYFKENLKQPEEKPDTRENNKDSAYNEIKYQNTINGSIYNAKDDMGN